MTAQALPRRGVNQERIVRAIRGLLVGRRNGHGSFTLNVSPATSTVVGETSCAPNSNVVITPTTATAANIQRTSDLYVTAGNGQFTVTHGATANSDCTFTYSIQG